MLEPVARAHIRRDTRTQELLDRTEPDHPDVPGLRLAVEKLGDVATLVNASLREAESSKKLVDLRRNVTGLQQLEAPGRTLVREGAVSLIKPRKSYRCILFTDLLVFAERVEVRRRRRRLRPRWTKARRR